MPKVNGSAWRSLIAEADWSPEDMAELLDLTAGSFRNVLAGREPTTERKIHRAARSLSAQLRRSVSFEDLVAEHDGVPDEPPEQPKQEPKPKRRKEPAETGPKRPMTDRVSA